MGQTLAKVALAFPFDRSFVVLQRSHWRWRVGRLANQRLLIADAPAALLLFNIVVRMGFYFGVLMAGGPRHGLRVFGLPLSALGGAALLRSTLAGLRTAPGDLIPPGLPEFLELVFGLVHRFAERFRLISNR